MSLKYQWLQNRPSRQKKTLFIIGLASVILLLIATYVFASMSAWESYQKEAVRQQNDVQNTTKKTLAMQVTSVEDRQKKQKAFVATAHMVDEASKRCEQSVLYEWQQVLPMYRNAVEACRAHVAKETALAKTLNDVTSYLNDEQKIIAIMTGVTAAKDGVSDTEWTTISEQWQQAVAKMKAVQVSEQLKKTKEQAITKLEAIHASWQALTEANQKKDRAQYEAAVGQMAKAYEGVGEVSTVSQASFTPLADAIERAYRQAFEQP